MKDVSQPPREKPADMPDMPTLHGGEQADEHQVKRNVQSMGYADLTGDFDENDPALVQIAEWQDQCAFSHLRALEESILNEDWNAYLKASKRSTNDLGSDTRIPAFEDTARTKRGDVALARFVNKIRMDAHQERERAVERAAQSEATALAQTAYDRWRSDDSSSAPEESRTRTTLPMWMARWKEGDSDFSGCGYQAKISEYEQRRYDSSALALGLATKVLRSGKDQRLESSLRVDAETCEGETLYLACDASVGQVMTDPKRASEHVNSVVVDEEVFSIVDTGTTVTIMDLMDGTVVDDFDSHKRVNIMGFNASVSQSKGSGTINGFCTAKDGSRVALRIPRVHDIKGSPNDLLSVSSLVRLGYEFHFIQGGSHMKTPNGELVELVERSGLYWLRWRRGVRSRSVVADTGIRRQYRAKAAAQEDRTSSCCEVEAEKYFGPALTSLSVEDLAEHECENRSCENCFLARGSRTAAIPLSLAHRRFAHFNPAALKKMIKSRAINVTLSDSKECECDVCRVCKATRRHVPVERERDPDELKPFERVWTDVKGKVSPKDWWGSQYIVTFTCEKTRWTYVDFAKKKSEIKDKYAQFLQWTKLQGYSVKVLNSDNGGEYTAHETASVISEFQEISKANGVTQNFTCAYTPEQNGVSERLNRTLVELARSLLVEAGLSQNFWTLAVKHVVHVKNRLWTRALQTSDNVSSSPFQALYGRAPIVDSLRVWGCDAFKLDHRQKENTFDRKAKKMIFVGIAANRKGWVLMDPKTRKLTTSYHCAFNEDMRNRRCALRDFDLRHGNKAGPAASKDDDRVALLERALYEELPVVHFDDEADQPVQLQPAAAVPNEHSAQDAEQGPGGLDAGAEEAYMPGGKEAQPRPPNPHDHEPEGVPGHSQRVDTQGHAHLETGGRTVGGGQGGRTARPDNRPRRGDRDALPEPQNGGSNASQPDNGGSTVQIKSNKFDVPQRRAAIGAKQDLDDEEYEFLKTAMQFNLPLVMQQRNPKKGASRLRYEKYKHGRTIRDLVKLGAKMDDVKWDYSRGYIDFSPTAASNATLARLVEDDRCRPIADSPGSYVDEDGNVLTNGKFSAHAFAECIQQDYAMMGIELIESMSHRAQKLLEKALDQETLVQFAHSCAARIMIPEPLTVKEAMASEHAAEWKAAMQEEIDTLVRFNTFDVTPKAEALRHGRLVKSKWVFKVKRDADGSVQRFKCRLVAKGFSQMPGTDYLETYSPVFSYGSFRTILALAVEKDLRLDGFDLKSSFLQQKLDVPHLYLETPDGFDKLMPDGSPSALHLRQSIYGLKQSSRLLHERMVKFLTSLGFKQTIADRCVFTKGEGQNKIIVAIWVDDVIVASARSNSALREAFDREITAEFEMSPWTTGEADWILNMKITRDWDKGTLHLSQPAAIEKLATQFGLTGIDGRAPHVPMSPTLKLTKPSDESIIPASEFDYQSAVGGLLYLSLTARPDVAYSVGTLSRFMACPAQEHVDAAKQVIRYLYGTKDYGITYTRGASGTPHIAQDEASLQVFVHSRKTMLRRKIPTATVESSARIVMQILQATRVHANPPRGSE